MMHKRIRDTYEIKYIRLLYNKFMFLFLTSMVTASTMGLILHQAKYFIFIFTTYLILFLLICFTYICHMLFLHRKAEHYKQFTASICSVEFSRIHRIRCCICFDDADKNRINSKTHYIFTDWNYSDLVSTSDITPTLEILYNSTTKQILVINNPSKRLYVF